MKLQKNLILLVAILLASIIPPLDAAPKQATPLQWTTNYAEATQLARETQRPIVLFFTGSDWCGWCTKLENEILETDEFMGAATNKFVFVKLDYPMKKKLDTATAQQNESLRQKFSVRSYPTIVLLDPEENPIGVTGYRSGGGKEYAAHLMKMVNDYSAYKQQMKRLGAQKFSGKDLKRLYQQATELGIKEDQNLLIRIGMDSDSPLFFMMEHYRFLVVHNQKNTKEAASIKEKLFALDSDNKFFSHYQVALIDFEANMRDFDKNQLSADDMIKPLLSYIEQFGSQDSEHLWRLNMEIYQVYLDQNRQDEALKFAQKSYVSAPSAIQPELAMAIRNIEKQTSYSRE